MAGPASTLAISGACRYVRPGDVSRACVPGLRSRAPWRLASGYPRGGRWVAGGDRPRARRRELRSRASACRPSGCPGFAARPGLLSAFRRHAAARVRLRCWHRRLVVACSPARPPSIVWDQGRRQSLNHVVADGRRERRLPDAEPRAAVVALWRRCAVTGRAVKAPLFACARRQAPGHACCRGRSANAGAGHARVSLLVGLPTRTPRTAPRARRSVRASMGSQSF